MNKEIAKHKMKDGLIQIEFNDKSKSNLLNYLVNKNGFYLENKYYKLNGTTMLSMNSKWSNIDVVKISDITEDSSEMEHTEMDEIFSVGDFQYREIGSDKWNDFINPSLSVEYRLKQKPDYNKEIEALQLKAKENGQKVVILFETL